MSLLPQQILPPSAPLVTKDQFGRYIIEKNWWLFLFNVANNSLSTDGSFPVASLQSIEATDIDSTSADLQQVQQWVANLQALQPEAEVTPMSLPAFWLLESPEDAIPNAQPAQAITVGASPFSYTAAFPGAVAVSAGTVSAIAILRQTATVATGVIAGVFPLSRGDQLRVTYTGTPTLVFLPS